MKTFNAVITKIEKRMNHYYAFEAASHIILIPYLDKILLELFKTPLREVMPLVYYKLIAQYIQEELYSEIIIGDIVNDIWKDYNQQE